MTTLKKAARISVPVKLLVLAVLILLVIYPLLRMFMTAKAEDFSAVVGSAQFSSALINSVLFSAIATVIVILIAYLLAFCMVRTDIKCKRLFDLFLILPMLIPSISHGMGLTTLFGNYGILTRLFGIGGTGFYGGIGIVTGSVLYAFPVAYIMLADVLKYQDLSVYEAADVLGLSPARQFASITLPFLKKPLIAAVFSTFSLIVTDYGVPLMVGGKTKTLALLMYEQVIGRMQNERGVVYATFLLIPAVVAFVADMLNKERATSAFVHKNEVKRTSVPTRILSYVFCTAVSVGAALPLVAFLIRAFTKKYPSDLSFSMKNFSEAFRLDSGEFLIHSLVIALATATVGVALAYLAAYLTARMRSPLSRIIHLLVLTFMAIPGLVLGLSYLTAFKTAPIAGTLVIMIMVNTAHFLSSPYLMMVNSFGKMNENLEAVGETLGVGRLRMIRDVFLPQNVGTVAEMFSYLFVNCMMTISAVAFLAGRNTKPLSLLINQFEAQSQFGCAAVVSLLILAANILVKTAVGMIKYYSRRRHRKEAVL